MSFSKSAVCKTEHTIQRAFKMEIIKDNIYNNDEWGKIKNRRSRIRSKYGRNPLAVDESEQTDRQLATEQKPAWQNAQP